MLKLCVYLLTTSLDLVFPHCPVTLLHPRPLSTHIFNVKILKYSRLLYYKHDTFPTNLCIEHLVLRQWGFDVLGTGESRSLGLWDYFVIGPFLPLSLLPFNNDVNIFLCYKSEHRAWLGTPSNNEPK